MKLNMGRYDRLIRIILAALVAVLFIMKVITGTLAIVLLAFGAIMLITGLAGRCPLYYPFKIRTNK